MKTRMMLILMLSSAVFAKVDLVTLPGRDVTQLTIYNSADLTLVRDARNLTLREGDNRLQFSWENTLIDPTSLSMVPKAHAGEIDIDDLTYPPRVRNLGIWNIRSEVAGSVPVEITYLTSGLSWRAFYMGTLTPDEKTMRLEGYVNVTNNSGEDYENAQTRLIVGQVHLLDEIVELARRQHPYGRPGEYPVPRAEPPAARGRPSRALGFEMVADSLSKVKEIRKEGLSEYFLYTIEGTETIPNQWSKRLPADQPVDAVPVVNLYKFEEDRYGPAVIRFLSFTNDEDHMLGDTPIPGGNLKVYRTVDEQRHLSYEGQSSFKYIPVGEEVELSLGPVSNVIVEPKLMDYKTDNYRFDNKGNISGWDEVRTFRIEVKNTRDLPVKVEIKRNFPHQFWSIQNSPEAQAVYEQVDMDTVKYTLTLDPASEHSFEYTVTSYEGNRREDFSKMQQVSAIPARQDRGRS